MSEKKQTKILICVGCGGVGKTTMASALAFKEAQDGKKVLVLTIDPSQRLKSTMQITESGLRKKIKHESLRGELYAEVIDPKKTFDEFVLKATAKSEIVQKLLNNPLYIQLSTKLSGSQEFTSLEKLYSAFESGDYDLIVLDTPPTQHALDFLEAPQKLFALFNERLTKWFINSEGQSFIGRLFTGGTSQVLKLLSRLTGAQFMGELSDFFASIQSRQKEVSDRTVAFQKLLHAEETEFCLVTSLDHAKLAEAEAFTLDLKSRGYSLSRLIVNRVQPQWLNDISTASLDMAQPESQFVTRLKAYYDERIKLLNEREFTNQAHVTIIKVPEFDKNISDLESVIEVVKWLNKQ